MSKQNPKPFSGWFPLVGLYVAPSRIGRDAMLLFGWGMVLDCVAADGVNGRNVGSV